MYIFSAEKGADFLAIHDALEHIFLIALGNDHIDARVYADFCGLHLGIHATGAPRCARAAGNGEKFTGEGGNLMNQLRIGMTLRVLVIKALDIRQNDEQVRFSDAGHDGR